MYFCEIQKLIYVCVFVFGGWIQIVLSSRLIYFIFILLFDTVQLCYRYYKHIYPNTQTMLLQFILILNVHNKINIEYTCKYRELRAFLTPKGTVNRKRNTHMMCRRSTEIYSASVNISNGIVDFLHVAQS